MATLNRKKEQSRAIRGALTLARQIGEFPAAKMSLDYDAEADVLYISLRRPQKATETIELEDEGILLRYRNAELVGITVLDASKR
jgi:uncharacterized protein YuzE